MPTHFALLQYDGAGFCGWQRQKTDRTVQGELESALERLNGSPVTAVGAGRTDAGVHALGQVSSFDLDRAWSCDELTAALNAHTPRDVWVDCAGPAPDGFHARKSARSRRYRYVVGTDSRSRSPFRRPYEWALACSLDQRLLEEGAAAIRGEHDFRALSSVGQVKPHYRCAVTEAEWQARDGAEGFIFRIEANRFLHRMVRFLVGAMVDVARDRRPADDLRRLLASEDNRESSPPAPPEGLYFVSAQYPNLHLGDDP